MKDGLLLMLVLFIMVPTVAITTVIPLLTRRIESFGVTIPEAEQKHARIAALRGQYLWLNGGLGLAITLSLLWLTQGSADERIWGFLFTGHIFGYLLVSFGIYLRNHYAVKRLKAQEGWMTDTVQRTVVSVKFRNEKLTYSSFWFIPHLLLIVGTILIGVLGYDRFPDVLPMQYGFDGEITRSVAKSYASVLWPAMVQSFLLLMFLFVNYIIGRSKQIVEASDPEGSLKRNVKFRRYWSGYMIIFGFLIMAMMDTFLLGLLFEWSTTVMTFIIMGTVGVILIGSIALSVKTGQGGSRIRLENGGTAGTSVQTGDQDQHWKLGQIYFNRNDPALFVEKRFGIGWTMNFGRPIVWLIAILILVTSITMTYFVD